MLRVPRGRLDIGCPDLALGILDAFCPWEPKTKDHWIPKDFRASLSVRTALDLFLQACNFPEGSEVVVSNVNIPDMFRILEHHGLHIIALDINQHTLSLDPNELENAITPRTKLVLFAHLFGAVVPLDAMIQLCHRKGVLFAEDCAQAFCGLNGYLGNEGSDAVFFSFGLIKTQTCLGGALWRVRDQSIGRRMIDIEGHYPLQKRWNHVQRILKAVVINTMMMPPFFNIVGMTLDLDALQGKFVRGFPGDRLLNQLRKRVHPLLAKMMSRRLTRLLDAKLSARRKLGLQYQSLQAKDSMVGDCVPFHTFWVHPMQVEDPDSTVTAYRMRGYDATRRASSLVHFQIAPPSRELLLMNHILFLPKGSNS
jgi:perosamine synthetase